MTTDLASLVNVEVEFLGTLIVPVDFTRPFDPVSVIFQRAERLTLTEDHLDAASAADPIAPMWSILDDADAQCANWGQALVRRATADAVEAWDGPAHPEYKRLYQEGMRRLRAMPPGEERRAETVLFAKRFPSPPTDTQETARYGVHR